LKRVRESLALKNPPVVLVLAQVRVSPVEAMANFVPEIQERFRKAGFPEMREGKVHGQFIVEGKPVAEHSGIQWEFVNKTNTTVIQLNLDAITVLTTEYTRFEDLEETFKLAVEVLHEIVAPSQVHRYGLRYVNFIPIGFGSNFVEWVRPHLLGHPNFPGAERIGSFSETVMVSDPSCRLAARCITMHAGIPIPGDLMPCNLKLRISEIPCKEPFAILDNDHGKTGPEDFDPTKAVETIAGLHNLLDLAFRTSVTDPALEKWK
jgi:uncharacterized protein (TIGR04255 family)